MDNQNKYYTPTIEEFHVGFEYERLAYDEDPKGKHVTVKYPCEYIEYQQRLSALEESLKTPKFGIRVKYLDQSDIESLGWEYRSPDWTCPHLLWFTKLNYKSIKSNKTDGNILFNPKDGWVLISEEYDSSDENKTRFAGYIKNKSELKVLMKQLGINE